MKYLKRFKLNESVVDLETKQDIDNLETPSRYDYEVNIFINNFKYTDSDDKWAAKTKPYFENKTNIAITGEVDFDDIKDMTLEMQDSGFTVKMDIRPKDRWMLIEISDISYIKRMQDNLERTYMDIENFNFSDIKDDVIRIVEYVNNSGGNCSIIISCVNRDNLRTASLGTFEVKVSNEDDVNKIPYELVRAVKIVVNNWTQKLQESVVKNKP